LHWQTICIQAVAACQSFAELLVGNFYRIRAAVELRGHTVRRGQTSQVHKLSSGGGLAVCPGLVFVVAGSVAEAAVQDADESVAEGA
jgi:hypothetical protein